MGKDARWLPRAAVIVVGVLLAFVPSAQAASHRTRFFLVTAPTVELARQVGEAAENARRDLAKEWLGKELPDWRDICPIYVTPARGAGGETRFVFEHGEPGKWQMTVQGPPDRILDSVVPHEVLHMVFATHFGQGLPRWADEGACTTVEHISERSKQEHLLYECLTTDRGIAFNKMFAMREYPKDMLPLYAQGYSVARFLIAVRGKTTFVAFVGEGLKTNNWTAATKRHFGFQSLSQLQAHWLEWVRQGGREELAANFFVQPVDRAVAVAEVVPKTAPNAESEFANANQPVANVVANVVAPRTLPPLSEPAFQVIQPASVYSSNPATAGRLVPVPPTAELAAKSRLDANQAAATAPARTGMASRSVATASAPSSASAGSWYASERDNHRANHSTGDANQAVARPQPVEQARETVIELDRPAGALFGTPLPGTTVSGPVRGVAGKVEPTRATTAAPSYAPGSTGTRAAAAYVSGARTMR